MKEPRITVTEHDIALARHALAMQILEADNAGDILQAMNRLTMTHAKRASDLHKTAKKKKSKKEKAKAKAWKMTADEFYTVTMCAVYTKQDQSNE